MMTRVKRPVDRQLLVASLVIAAGLVLIGFAFMRSVTGSERTKLPDQIERISPLPDAITVPSRSGVVVDLADGYTGRLVVDGTAFPTQQLSDANREPGTQVVVPPGVVFEGGTNTLTLTLGDEVGFDEWPDGVHLIDVEYWPILDGEDSAAAGAYRWSFSIV